jgi:tRNA(Ile)-lysidine synthase
MLSIEVIEQVLKNASHYNKQAIYGLACSGGKDSMALAHLLHHLQLPLVLMHCNFSLRGAESQRDQDFVLAFAAAHDIPCRHIVFDTEAYAATHKLSIQEAARTLRYHWFKEVLHSFPHQKKYLVTAHHANDNVETLLLNFFRGTGLKGLQGIPKHYSLGNIEVLRPLLDILGSDIIAYNQQHTIHWVHDSSNDTIKYERNFLRQEVVPMLEKRIPHFTEKMLGNIQRFTTLQQTYNDHIAHIKKQIAFTYIGKQPLQPGEVAMPIRMMLKLGIAYCMPYVEQFGFSTAQQPEIEKLIQAINGKYCKAAYGNYIIRKYNLWFIIAPFSNENVSTIMPTNIFIEQGEIKVAYGNGMLTLETLATNNIGITSDSNVAMLDASLITWPLVLRPYKEGDYFYPLGMPKKKKISRFLIDIKIPKEKRSNVWVLESNKKIIWVVGYRISDKFKIHPTTQKILMLKHI